MARLLTDPLFEEAIQATAAAGPVRSPDQAAHLVRLLRLDRPGVDRAA